MITKRTEEIFRLFTLLIAQFEEFNDPEGTANTRKIRLLEASIKEFTDQVAMTNIAREGIERIVANYDSKFGESVADSQDYKNLRRILNEKEEKLQELRFRVDKYLEKIRELALEQDEIYLTAETEIEFIEYILQEFKRIKSSIRKNSWKERNYIESIFQRYDPHYVPDPTPEQMRLAGGMDDDEVIVLTDVVEPISEAPQEMVVAAPKTPTRPFAAPRPVDEDVPPADFLDHILTEKTVEEKVDQSDIDALFGAPGGEDDDDLEEEKSSGDELDKLLAAPGGDAHDELDDLFADAGDSSKDKESEEGDLDDLFKEMESTGPVKPEDESTEVSEADVEDLFRELEGMASSGGGAPAKGKKEEAPDTSSIISQDDIDNLFK
ncbi:MAG: hypothetical protein HQK60_08575 [Deltaproteobacteria bacterium]|nr:hypothetical protein [Deltaproteobacteria bacterium]